MALPHPLVDTPARELRDIRNFAACPNPIRDLSEERVSVSSNSLHTHQLCALHIIFLIKKNALIFVRRQGGPSTL